MLQVKIFLYISRFFRQFSICHEQTKLTFWGKCFSKIPSGFQLFYHPQPKNEYDSYLKIQLISFFLFFFYSLLKIMLNVLLGVFSFCFKEKNSLFPTQVELQMNYVHKFITYYSSFFLSVCFFLFSFSLKLFPLEATPPFLKKIIAS